MPPSGPAPRRAVRDLDQLRAALAGAERAEGWGIAQGLDHNAFGGRPVDRALIEDNRPI
ncbi:hypothetical protein ACFRQM_07340 [Streptomyces sp. NPDC056831]|uniref:hypothetical protein n=1 Tax=Streptomyces sp. NPDC056831 TaxID=3345954 RepID=UPI0036A62059